MVGQDICMILNLLRFVLLPNDMLCPEMFHVHLKGVFYCFGVKCSVYSWFIVFRSLFPYLFYLPLYIRFYKLGGDRMGKAKLVISPIRRVRMKNTEYLVLVHANTVILKRENKSTFYTSCTC